jgi:succinate dehydrogenase/fumarate reductase flavoprotein subunit
VGLVRNDTGLTKTLAYFKEIQDYLSNLPLLVLDVELLTMVWETRNLVITSHDTTLIALTSCESRGSHFRADFPIMDEVHWLKNIIVSLESSEWVLRMNPVQFIYIKPTIIGA